MDKRSTTAKDLRWHTGAGAQIIAALRAAGGGRRRRRPPPPARVVLGLLLGAIALLSAGGGGDAMTPAEAQSRGASGPRDSKCYYSMPDPTPGDPNRETVVETDCPCHLKVVQSHEITDDDGNRVSNPVGFDDAKAVALDQAKLIIEGGDDMSLYRIRMQCDFDNPNEPMNNPSLGGTHPDRFIRYQTGIIDQTRVVNVGGDRSSPISDNRAYRGVAIVPHVGYIDPLATDAKAYTFHTSDYSAANLQACGDTQNMVSDDYAIHILGTNPRELAGEPNMRDGIRLGLLNHLSMKATPGIGADFHAKIMDILNEIRSPSRNEDRIEQLQLEVGELLRADIPQEMDATLEEELHLLEGLPTLSGLHLRREFVNWAFLTPDVRQQLQNRLALPSRTWDASDAARDWGILVDAMDGPYDPHQEWNNARPLDFELQLCSHGTGRLAVMTWDRSSTNFSSHPYRITPNYPIATSEISDALFDIPGGPLAAQLLLSLITGFLFWGAGGFITRGSTGAQPMLGLVGFVIGALAMPVFGYGGWFLAVIIIIIALASAMFFAQAVSGRV